MPGLALEPRATPCPHGINARNCLGATSRPGIGAEGDRMPSCGPATGQEEDHMRYEAPNSLDQAVALLAHEPGEARVLAGGTDLLVQMRTDLIDPILVVDIKGIAELRQITEEAGGFRVGAAVTGALSRVEWCGCV